MILRFYVRMYGAFIRSRLEYRADLLVSVGTSLLAQASAFSLYLAVFSQDNTTLRGASGPEVLLLFGFVAAVLGVTELLFNGIWSLPEYVLSGRLDRILVSPAHSLLYLLFSRPELHGIGNLLVGGLMLLGSSQVLAFSLADQLLLVWWVVCGAGCYTAILIFLGALSFVIVGPFGDHLQVVVQLFQACRYPLRIYPAWLKFALLFLLPLGLIARLPDAWSRSQVSLWEAVVVPVVAAGASALLALLSWHWGLRRYHSTGS